MTDTGDSADLQQALDGRYPYSLLSASLRQRFTQREYITRTIQYSILRAHAYHRLPDFVKVNITEREYYQEMLSYSAERLQLYPYIHQHKVVFYTSETPLTYYRGVLASMLRTEQSYDRLPNFTACDVLNLLGVGRNEYLRITKEVRSSLRWHVNRSYVPDYLPQELLPSVALAPFWSISPVEMPTEQFKKKFPQGGNTGSGSRSNAAEGSNTGSSKLVSDAFALYRLLITKGRAATGVTVTVPFTNYIAGGSGGQSSSNITVAPVSASAMEDLGVSACYLARDTMYVCELPAEPLYYLYRKGLVLPSFTVSPEERFTVPPLEQFVMNRTSDDPQELLLCRVLSTLDSRTPIQLLAQLLMMEEADVCSAAKLLLQLGLAQPVSATTVPDGIVTGTAVIHPSWQSSVNAALKASAQQYQKMLLSSTNASPPACSSQEPPSPEPTLKQRPVNRGYASEDARCTSQSASHLLPLSVSEELFADSADGTKAKSARGKRIAVLYDATLTGFLMMTNLSSNPTFKQLAVTLFEVGKMPDEVVGHFLELLGEIDLAGMDTFGGEAAKYIHSVLCLRELLHTLRSIPDPEAPNVGGSSSSSSSSSFGVDLLKIESLNELEATTRYSVLARSYWAYVVVSPIASAPLIDVELSCVYGNTVGLMASPWLTLFAYSKLCNGPPSVLLPFGFLPGSWPPSFWALEEAGDAVKEEEVMQQQHCGDHVGNGGQSDANEDEMDIPLGALADTVVGYGVRVRLQTVALDSEVSYSDLHTSLLLINETTASAPVFAQCSARTPLTARTRAAVPPYSMGPTYSRASGGDATTATSIGGVAVVAEAADYVTVEVAVPFTATEAMVLALATEKLHGDSTAGTYRTEATEKCSEVCSDPHGRLWGCLEDAVTTLHLQDSIGYCVLSVSAMLYRGSSSESSEAERPPLHHSYCVESVCLVHVGLGVPLVEVSCCLAMLKSLPELLTEPRAERHNTAMRACMKEYGEFLERYSPVTREVHERMSIQTTAAVGPMTQMHLRNTGGNGGAPYPAFAVLFDGKEISIVDEARPLCELW